MSDKKTEQMLKIANLLTAEDLDGIRTSGPPATANAGPPDDPVEVQSALPTQEDPDEAADEEPSSVMIIGITTGQRERLRSRESKVSTSCMGQQRAGHEWWAIGTQLEGRIGNERFIASVVENSRVKSGRSLLIDSGPAQGRVCLTPTRAAIEATEEYRRIANLGRGGGITNGWTFWKPKQ